MNDEVRPCSRFVRCFRLRARTRRRRLLRWPGRSRGHGPLEKTHLVVDDFPSVDSAGLYIAEQEGLFRAQGLDVTIVPVFTSSQQTVTDIEGGRADISSGDYVTYMHDELADNDMIQFGFLPKRNASFSVSGISYPGNLAAAPR